jgi:hypothetical protein
MAAYALYNIGDNAYEDGLLKMAQGVQHVRRKLLACIALGGCGTQAAFDVLEKLVKGDDQEVRVCAGIALAEIGCRYVQESIAANIMGIIEPLWQERSYAVRAALVQYCAEIGYRAIAPKAVRELRVTYGDGPFAAYRALMATALGQLKDPATDEALAEAALGDPSPLVSEVSRKAYTNVTGKPTSDSFLSHEEATRRYRTHFADQIADDVWANSEFTIRTNLYTPGAVHRCAICRSHPETFVRVSHQAQIGDTIYTYSVGVPVCNACQVDSFPPALLSMPSDKDWRIAFGNAGFTIMNRDNTWLATNFASARSIFS